MKTMQENCTKQELEAAIVAAQEEGRELKLGGANQDVIELLELYLGTAQREHFKGVGIVLVGWKDVAAIDWAGEIRSEKMILEAADRLRERIDGSIGNWHFPPRDESLDASYVRFSLAAGPLGFDYLTWLVRSEMIRRMEGAPAPLKVGFWCGADGKYLVESRRKAWLDNVFRPALSFVGAVEDERAVYGHNEETYVPNKLVIDYRNGAEFPFLKPETSVAKSNVITITLREKLKGDLYRNSNTDAWMRFASMLNRRGEKVVIVRDTARADEPLRGMTTCPTASRDLKARMALYATAKMNWFVENGPAALCQYSEYPWTMFWNVDGASKMRSIEGIKVIFGLHIGEQYPWCRDDQRIEWAADSYDNIMSAWEQQIFLSGLRNRRERAA